MAKNFYIEENTVYYHDGVKTEKNGNPIYEIKACAGKRACKAFTDGLKDGGYVERIKF